MKTSIHIPVLSVLFAAGFNFCSAQFCMVSVIPPAATICPGSCITLNTMFQSSPPCTAVSYSWNTGQTTSSIIVCPTVSTTYTVTAMCLTTSCVATNSVSVTINPPTGAIIVGLDSICLGDSTGLCFSGGISYSWLPSGQTTACIAVSPSVTTTYTAIATDVFGCTTSDTHTLYVDNCTGTAENDFSNQISIFPNPFSQSAIIRIAHAQLLPCEFRIYDLFGREIKKYRIQNTETKITRDNFSSGLYFYRLLQKEQLIGKGKLLIEQ